MSEEDDDAAFRPATIIWKGRQWAVTEYGLETLGEPYLYSIEAGRLAETWDDGTLGLPQHMMEKEWLDVDDFVIAWLLALQLHGKGTRLAGASLIVESLEQIARDRALVSTVRAAAPPPAGGSGVYRMSELVRPHQEGSDGKA